MLIKQNSGRQFAARSSENYGIRSIKISTEWRRATRATVNICAQSIRFKGYVEQNDSESC